jgi:uncharacterized membrane-anchored protein
VSDGQAVMRRVPEVTLGFWVVKVLATTLGETGGDAVSMSLDLGYLLGTIIFAIAFAIAIRVQLRTDRYRPVAYWTAIVATTTVGTTMADFVTRSLGIGYPGGSLLLTVLLVGSLLVWYRTLGSIAVASVQTSRAEVFYWTTIMFSQTLGTALGDWTADTAGLGYSGAAAIFAVMLLVVAAAYQWTRLSRPVLFWLAFILTRPLGAVVGDYLDKPTNAGGLGFDRLTASGVLLAAMVVGILLLPMRPADSAASH